jgi:glycosyltransferase involved in cell wall biosynthesis
MDLSSSLGKKPSDMLLVVPVPFLIRGGTTFFEAQACNGLRRWTDNFERVVVAAPVAPESLAAANQSMVWISTDTLDFRERLQFLYLPWAYDLITFMTTYAATRSRLGAALSQCSHLQFAIGGVVGDWAAVAAAEAIRQRRRFAIHTDRVEHEVLMQVTRGSSARRRIKAVFVAGVMKRYHRHVIRRCSLGLWHGSDCYKAYSPWCKENHLIHDIHTKASDCIEGPELETKAADAACAAGIRVCYAGRMDAMKAPLDWLRAIAVARDLGAPIRAIWFGDGPMRQRLDDDIRDLKLGGTVELPGFLADRAMILSELRASQIMAFTHVTPESPRCLLEALISGTPIVGYESSFARDLTDRSGGGAFVPMHDWHGLGVKIAELSADRARLAELILQAGKNGRRFNDETVFAERSRLVKEFAGLESHPTGRALLPDYEPLGGRKIERQQCATEARSAHHINNNG